MKFRPCIDIHNGRVKQIVGASLRDGDESTVSFAEENYVADRDAVSYAALFDAHGLTGGHVIILNAKGTPEYEASRREALSVLKAFPGTWQAGGGITPENAAEFLNAGASHVIVTSYVFREGRIDEARLSQMVKAVGRSALVLDLSCKKVTGAEETDTYRVVTDRWTRLSATPLNRDTLERLSRSSDEFLIHAADVEGRQQGIETGVVKLLSEVPGITCTYAGGIHSVMDIRVIKSVGKGHIDCTVGSALDVYGGHLALEDVVEACG